ncbi:hypothetical protein TNCV_674871 [Trichonephila clavipes]|nr:hypothetical protein TNCV_674871 [Trichonephila clavipes]
MTRVPRRLQTARNVAVLEKVENLNMIDRCLTVPKTAEQVEISTGSSHAILCNYVQSGCKISSQSLCRWNRKNSVLQLYRINLTLPTLNLAPYDFWLFSKMKMSLKGSRVQSRAIPKEAFNMCFRLWKESWAKCMKAPRAYFEFG